MAYPHPQEGPQQGPARPGGRAVGPAAPSRRSPPPRSGPDPAPCGASAGRGGVRHRPADRPAAVRRRRHPADRPRHRPGRDRARGCAGPPCPTFSDAILVYLRDPLPVGDETARRPAACCGCAAPTGSPRGARHRGRLRAGLAARARRAAPRLGAELCEVRPGGALAEVLRAGVRCSATLPRAARRAARTARRRRRASAGAARTAADPGPAARPPPGHRRRRLPAPPRPAAFDRDDLLVAAQLATHTALGIDKAVLYGREAYIADELQRTMLPDSLPQPTGVRLASRYLPAAETARVGGDWYDAIPLPGSRVALVVGDVMGHSMTSAAIMGQLRTTAQTLAGLDLPPQEVLHHLDEQAQRLGSRPHGDLPVRGLRPGRAPHHHRQRRSSAAGAAAPGRPRPRCCGCRPARRSASAASTSRRWSWTRPPGRPCCCTPTAWWSPATARRVDRHRAAARAARRDRAAHRARPPPPLEALCDEVLDMLGPGRPGRRHRAARRPLRRASRRSDVAYWFLEPEDADRRAGPAGWPAARCPAGVWRSCSDSVELLVSEVVTNAVRYADPAGHAAAAADGCAALRGGRRRRRSCPGCGRPGPPTRADAGCSW